MTNGLKEVWKCQKADVCLSLMAGIGAIGFSTPLVIEFKHTFQELMSHQPDFWTCYEIAATAMNGGMSAFLLRRAQMETRRKQQAEIVSTFG